MEKAVLLISDTHIGKRTASYDLDVAEKRLQFVGERVTHLIKHHQPQIKSVAIFLLGDIVDGEEVYPSQSYCIDHVRVDTLKRVAPMMQAWQGTFSVGALLQTYLAAQFLHDHIVKPLLDANLKVELWAVAGNHGSPSIVNLHPMTNFDQFAYLLLSEMVKPYKIPCNASPSPYLVADICGKRFLLYHGTGIKVYQRIPLYGIMTKAVNWLAYKQFGHIDAICLGHFHVACYFPVVPIIFLNGTPVTDDLYPVEKMGVTGINYFLFFGVSDKWLPTFIYPIFIGNGYDHEGGTTNAEKR